MVKGVWSGRMFDDAQSQGTRSLSGPSILWSGAPNVGFRGEMVGEVDGEFGMLTSGHAQE